LGIVIVVDAMGMFTAAKLGRLQFCEAEENDLKWWKGSAKFNGD
jgi:hypothetical protein